MIVFSPLSLYTTYLGWQQYEVIFDALWQTGVLYIGFLMLGFRYLKNMLAPAGATQNAAEHALNHFLYELALVFFICGVFLYPSVPLSQKGLSFKPMCVMKAGDTVKDSHIKDSGTTYDEAFADVLSESIKLPLGFAILQNYTSSLTYGLMKVTGCTDSLHAIQGDLVSTYIPESLRKEALQFHHQCFLEARSRYVNEEHDKATQTRIDGILKRHGGEEDVSWLGSKTFKTLYYVQLSAREPIRGFSYQDYPNTNFKNAAKSDKNIATHLPKNGFPTCNQWWDKIQKKLVKTTEKAGMFDSHLGKFNVETRIMRYKDKHKLSWNSDLSAEDYIAKVLLNDNRDMQLKSTEGLMAPTNNALGGFFSRGLVNLGQSLKSVTSTPLKREATMQTLPVMQAFFYFFLIVLTPIVLALSGYSPRALGSLCALYVMAILIQYLWHLVSYLEKSILDPMGENDIIAAMRNMAVLFYYIAPGILLKLSSHFGGEGGVALAGMVGASEKTAQDSAEAGMATVKFGFNAARGKI
jgi:hypothetical protein